MKCGGLNSPDTSPTLRVRTCPVEKRNSYHFGFFQSSLRSKERLSPPNLGNPTGHVQPRRVGDVSGLFNPPHSRHFAQSRDSASAHRGGQMIHFFVKFCSFLRLEERPLFGEKALLKGKSPLYGLIDFLCCPSFHFKNLIERKLIE